MSVSRQSYFTLTIHFLQNSKLEAVLLSIQHLSVSSTGENIKAVVDKALNQFRDIKVTAAVTDNTANMVAACKLMKVLYVPCSVHTI